MTDARNGSLAPRIVIENEICRQPRVFQGGHIERGYRHPHAVMLETGLITEPLAVLIDDDVTIRRHPHDESRLVFGKLETHWCSDGFHVPEIGADFLRELDTVSLIPRMSI